MLEKKGKWGVPFMDIEGIYVTRCSEKKIRQAVDRRPEKGAVEINK
jgi:hypothetical protein